MTEVDKIKHRYDVRKTSERVLRHSTSSTYSRFIVEERELKYRQILNKHFEQPALVKMLEVGAGTGGNLPFFQRMGIPSEHIHANELLHDRFEQLHKNFPGCKSYLGNALDLPFSGEFDLVFQSTVFTSILDSSFKKLLAEKLLDMTRPGGIVLWYDFIYNNPANPDVKGVSRKEIKALFQKARSIQFHSVTLAPPIGRRTGSLYPLINGLFPFLRSHIIAVITK